jgi:hypothetical protein
MMEWIDRRKKNTKEREGGRKEEIPSYYKTRCKVWPSSLLVLELLLHNFGMVLK